MAYIEAIPAYGRDYTSQAAVKSDWKAGKDFQDAATGRYLNNADVEADTSVHVLVRYAKNLKVMQVK